MTRTSARGGPQTLRVVDASPASSGAGGRVTAVNRAWLQVGMLSAWWMPRLKLRVLVVAESCCVEHEAVLSGDGDNDIATFVTEQLHTP